MELRHDSSACYFGCFALLIHVQVLLMRTLFQSGSRDALAHLLVLHSRLSVLAELLALTDFETVHLRLQSNKLDDQIALRFVVEKANYAFIWVVRCSEAARVIRWDFADIEQALQLRHVQKLFIKVLRKELHDTRFGVCVEHPHFSTVPVF